MSNRLGPFLYFAAGAAVYGAFSVLHQVYQSIDTTYQILPSPLSSSASSDKSLPYPASDYIPGSRDISTPLGSMRIYEFGPENAERKVLLIHGISTACISLTGIAERLSNRGCRVMMFDLFGRGYSDAPPGPYDERFYTTQILMALASSPISWTGTGNVSQGFSVIGYSLGGGIAANFTSYFPYLVDDLVLIAPGGILRPHHYSNWQNRLLYSGILPEFLITRVVKRRLLASSNDRTSSSTPTTETNNSDVISAEVVNVSTTSLAFGRSIDPETVAKWQMESHPGFIPAVLSSYQHAPICDQHARWRAIGKRLDAQRAAKHGAIPDPDVTRQGLRAGKVLMVLATMDDAICTPEVVVDAREVFGDGNVEILEIECGHEVPMTHGKEVVEFIWKHWEGSE